ncbi:MAG TPA: PKD domain-containing protein, partial [Xanthomonadaceae bacterium]|nr:PKD domain-containing protein [Xanthomonadaceae bacterium]
AFDADPNTGSLVTVNGGLQQWGGTSLAAPIFSGLWARVLATKGTNIGFADPLIYQLPQFDFHDITVGNNGGETAGVGYDFASGRGSISLSAAISNIGQPVGYPPVASFTYTTSGLAATFTDTSTDKDGTVVAHFWNFGDNSPVVTTANSSHTYLGAGTYNVSETVEDSKGNVRIKTTPVTVVPPGGANQLIANTGFETGTSPWVFSSTSIRNNNNFAEPSHGGQWDAWLGATGNSTTDSISQQVTIPSGKTTATLQFFLHIDTKEVSQTRKFDNMSVGVYSTGGALLGTLATYSNLNAASGYQAQTFSMTPWIGQTVVLKFSAREDSSLPTEFVVDDVTLQVQ